jgi:hypothetical protein
MSSSGDDVLGLRDEVARLRAAIDSLRDDVRAVLRSPERSPRRRLSGSEGEPDTPEARQAAVEALAKALSVEFGAPDARVRFGPSLQGGGLVAFPGSTSLLSPRGPAMTALFLVSTLLQRQNAPAAPVSPVVVQPDWNPVAADANASVAVITPNLQLADLNNATAIESAADTVLDASTWSTVPPVPENIKNQVEALTDEELAQVIDDVSDHLAAQPPSAAPQQTAPPSAPVPPSPAPEPNAGGSRGWGSIAGNALSYIQNNPFAQTVVIELAKRVKKAVQSGAPDIDAADEPAVDPAPPSQPTSQAPPLPEDPDVADAPTRADLILQRAATEDSPPGSPSPASSTAIDTDADAPPSTEPGSASSAYALPMHQTLEEAAREYAGVACGDAPGGRAEVVNEVIQLVQAEKPGVDANDARARLEGALTEACAAHGRGLLAEALLDAQSLRERVRQLAGSFNHT